LAVSRDTTVGPRQADNGGNGLLAGYGNCYFFPEAVVRDFATQIASEVGYLKRVVGDPMGSGIDEPFIPEGDVLQLVTEAFGEAQR
jgi:hypothetical protein